MKLNKISTEFLMKDNPNGVHAIERRFLGCIAYHHEDPCVLLSYRNGLCRVAYLSNVDLCNQYLYGRWPDWTSDAEVPFEALDFSPPSCGYVNTTKKGKATYVPKRLYNKWRHGFRPDDVDFHVNGRSLQHLLRPWYVSGKLLATALSSDKKEDCFPLALCPEYAVSDRGRLLTRGFDMSGTVVRVTSKSSVEIVIPQEHDYVYYDLSSLNIEGVSLCLTKS